MSTKLSVSFVKNFKSDALIEPKPICQIENYEQNKQLFELNEHVQFDAYVKKRNVLLLIVIVPARGKIKKLQYYKDLFINSDLISSDYYNADTKAYFMIYKNKTTHPVLFYDMSNQEQEELEEIEDDKFCHSLIGFGNVFDTLDNAYWADAKKELTDIIQMIWDTLHYDTKTRTVFIIITWILLSHDEICFKKHPTRGKLSLKQWLDLDEQHTKASDKKSEEYKADEKFLKSTSSVEIIDGFKKVLMEKMSTFNKNRTRFEQECNEKQIERLEGKVNSLYSPKTQKLALSIASAIYERIYKKSSKVDISKLAFDAEQKWRQTQKAANANDNLGQFYTPRMIKELSVKYIFGGNIENGSTCYDPTCGTGGFAKEFYSYCIEKQITDTVIYGNEIDEDCANMAWLAGLASTCDTRFFEGDCFDPELKSEIIRNHSLDFLLMNPPFGTKVQKNFLGFPEGFDWSEDSRFGEKEIKPTEWTFCRYNLESFVKIGGWFAFIMPISAVSKKEFEYDKQCLIDEAEIWFIVRFNENIFKPQTGQPICMILGKFCGERTKEEIDTWKTKCIDFSEDSGKIGKGKNAPYTFEDVEQLEKMINLKILNGKDTEGLHMIDDENVCPFIRNVQLIENEEGKEFYIERVLKANENWLFKKYEKDEEGMRLRYRLNRLDAIHAEQRTRIIQEELEAPEIEENEKCEWREVKISDVFDIMKKPSGDLKYDVNECSETMTESKKVPYYSMIDHNNGLKGYVEKAAINGNDWYIIVGNYSSKAKNGKQTSNHKNSYCCYVIQAPFNYDSVHTIIIRRKDEFSYLTPHDLHFIAFNIGLEFTERFSHGDALTGSKLLEQVVKLPFDTEDDKLKPSVCSWYECDEWKVKYHDVRVDEMFERVKVKGFRRDELKRGYYPLIMSGIGINEYVDKFAYDQPCISVNTTGTVGYCQALFNKFSILDSAAHPPTIIKLKSEYSYLEPVLFELSFIMSERYQSMYAYSAKLNNTNLFNEIIPQLPFIDDPLNPGHEILDISTLQTMLLRPTPSQIRRKQIQQEMKEQNSPSTIASSTASTTAANSEDETIDERINETAKRTVANEENQKRRNKLNN